MSLLFSCSPPWGLGRISFPSRRGPPCGPSLLCRLLFAVFLVVSFLVLLALVRFLVWVFFSSSFSLLSRFLSSHSCLPWSFSTSLSSWRVCIFPSPLGFFFSYSLPLLSASSAATLFSCSIPVRLQLCYTFTLICYTLSPYRRRETSKFPRLPPHFFSFDSSVPRRLLRLAHPSIPAGSLCPWDSVARPLPYRVL